MMSITPDICSKCGKPPLVFRLGKIHVTRCPMGEDGSICSTPRGEGPDRESAVKAWNEQGEKGG